jgi:AMP-binding enzyme C-terminal domain
VGEARGLSEDFGSNEAGCQWVEPGNPRDSASARTSQGKYAASLLGVRPVSLRPGLIPSTEIEEKVSKAIETEIGKIARPKNVWIVPDMPKTRSGKIMRRVIAGISNFAAVGDTTTLANPEIVDDIRHHVQSEKVARGEVPRELSPQELEELKAFGGAE